MFDLKRRSSCYLQQHDAKLQTQPGKTRVVNNSVNRCFPRHDKNPVDRMLIAGQFDTVTWRPQPMGQRPFLPTLSDRLHSIHPVITETYPKITSNTKLFVSPLSPQLPKMSMPEYFQEYRQPQHHPVTTQSSGQQCHSTQRTGRDVSHVSPAAADRHQSPAPRPASLATLARWWQQQQQRPEYWAGRPIPKTIISSHCGSHLARKLKLKSQTARGKDEGG